MNDKQLIIGISGRICMGKTYLADTITEKCTKLNFSVKIIYADTIAHELYKEDKTLVKALVDTFGPTIVDDKNNIIRSELSNILYANVELFSKLNSIVWPKIKERIQQYISKSNENIIIVEAAVLFLAKWTDLFDYIIHIQSDKDFAKTKAIKLRKLDEDKFEMFWKAQDCIEELVKFDKILTIFKQSEFERCDNEIISLISGYFSQTTD